MLNALADFQHSSSAATTHLLGRRHVAPLRARRFAAIRDELRRACAFGVRRRADLPADRTPSDGCCSSLADQELADLAWEILVVDNDVARSALDTVTSCAPGLQPVVRYLHEPTPGSASARNRGVAEAQAAMVALVDDDVVVATDCWPSWCAPSCRVMPTRREAGVVLDRPTQSPGWFDYDRFGPYLTSFDLGDHPLPLGLDDYLISASAVFRTELLRAVGGFDLELGPSGGGTSCATTSGCTARWYGLEEGSPTSPPPRWSTSSLPIGSPAASCWPGPTSRVAATGSSIGRCSSRSRVHGLRVALLWLRAELGRRWADGLQRRSVRFHLLTDLVRVAGNIREIVRWSRPSR